MRVVVLFVLALALASCASSLSRAEAVDSFQAANPDASTEQSACVIDALIEGYEVEPVDEGALDGLEAALSAEPPEEQFLLDQFRATFGCGMTGGVEAQLQRELLANDIDGEAVECVAEALAGRLTDDDIEVLVGADARDAEMTDSFYASFFAAVEGCDALPS